MVHIVHPLFPFFLYHILLHLKSDRRANLCPVYVIVSADYMWLHIRGVGEWTNRLYNYFEHEQEKLHSVEEQLAGNRQLVINGTPETKGIKRLQV
jgi:hypothetical protein